MSGPKFRDVGMRTAFEKALKNPEQSSGGKLTRKGVLAMVKASLDGVGVSDSEIADLKALAGSPSLTDKARACLDKYLAKFAEVVEPIKDKGLRRVVGKFIANDGDADEGRFKLTEAEVREIVLATYDMGKITADEVRGLEHVLATADFAPASVKDLLRSEIGTLHRLQKKHKSGTSSLRHKSQGHAIALNKVKRFQKRKGPTAFAQFKRDKIAAQLRERILQPSLMTQRNTMLCGPFAFLYTLAVNRPADYAQLAISLYEQGKANLGELSIEPSPEFRQVHPTHARSKIGELDWMLAGALRNSYNLAGWKVDHAVRPPSETYLNPGDMAAAMTLIGTMETWLDQIGFTKVESEGDNWKVFSNPGEEIVKQINQKRKQGWQVLLLVNSKGVAGDASKQTLVPTHWVVVSGELKLVPGGKAGYYQLDVYSWGHMVYRKVPKETFEDYVFGAVYAKF